MEIPFPRGGHEITTENKKKRERVTSSESSDELFIQKKSRKVEKMIEPSLKRKKSLKEIKEVKKSLPEIGLGMTKVIGNQQVFKIERISFQKYLIGTMAFGYIIQVTNERIILSLPGGITAIVPYNETTDIHHKYYNHPNEQVFCLLDLH